MGNNSISEILKGSRRKLEEEKEREIRGICKIRMKVKNLKKDPNEGPREENQQRRKRSIEKYEKQCTEREGKVIGLEMAIDFVEQSKEGHSNRAPSPWSSPQPAGQYTERL